MRLIFAQAVCKKISPLVLLKTLEPLQIDFLKSALLDDELLVTVEVKERRAASILFSQTIKRADGSCVIRAKVRVACVDIQRMRAAPIPTDLIPAPAC